MKKVFSQAALGFGAFGGIVCGLSALSKISNWDNGPFWGILGLCAFISGLCFTFYYFPKYRSNPIEVRPSFVKRAYISLLFTYGAIFCLLLKGLNLINPQINVFVVGGALFGITLLVYAIPASIGFLMNKHSRAVSLHKFLSLCYMAYLVIFLASLVTIFFTDRNVYKSTSSLLFVLAGIIIFITPILSVYRMKTVVRYLDKSDDIAIRKWELFFVFEILAQLMQMALYISRFVIYYCLGCCNSRRY